MQRKGIFSKMVIFYMVINVATFMVLAIFLSFWFEKYSYDQRKESLLSQSAIISELADKYVNNEIGLNEATETLDFIGEYLKADIWLIDSSGYVYAVSNKENNKYLRNQLFKDDIKTLKDNNIIERKKVKGNIYENYVHVLEVPIINYQDQFLGAVIMNTPDEQIKEPVQQVYFIIRIASLLIILPACILIYWFSQKMILKPLNKISSTAMKISKGEVEKRVYIDSNDEIGTLANSFNSMADSLEKVEHNRRHFISNVSHEIRTPITSIKGFIGGILDGVVPKEKQKHYLTMAYEETERLTRLVNDLLNLSAIESGEFSLIMEELDVNELIRITVLKLESKIKQKGLKVDVRFDNDALLVQGDKDRLIQVLTNLIDNAVKYAKENGSIKIISKTKGKKVFISIYNDGEQISEEDLKHIWQRFYRADKARTCKESTGLGLSIVRGILTQLKQDIWVENKDNGVCFSFTLNRVR